MAGLLDSRRAIGRPPTLFAPFMVDAYRGPGLSRFYRGQIAGKKMLLVDDVRNTGQTLARCATIVRAAGGAVIATAEIYDRMESMTDAGVPKLVLLSEQEPASESNAAELAAAPESIADLRNDTCASIGPFATQADMRGAINALTPLVNRVQYREAHATETRGYWVYLPAMSSREQALAIARQLSAKGVRDYYVVTAGDQQNTISLGLFRDRGNAEKRRNEVAALGFSPDLVTRTEELPVYWIDFASDQGLSRNGP
jgi:hypothetical protein